ncbi:hypothetical protein NUU61_006753 [Penicillium alfredii]|uniref:Berberine/berberine-like domain-containing protein n=1 Tax=Penicillium alfredii TaxID=1506179 RepID=A0A9W9F1E7_9EURO|nr:uncharacterized protein NUU61_006753 [Penicillium alfredii]KAJ5091883.1 hypothetical protein NUU61_006753 [Penicillium alfredii]
MYSTLTIHPSWLALISLWLLANIRSTTAAPQDSNTTPSSNSPAATSSVHSLQNEISATLIPKIESLLNTPNKKKAQDTIDEIDKVKPGAEELLHNINPESSSTSNGKAPGTDLSITVSQIEDSLKKVTSAVQKSIKNHFSNTNDIANTLCEITELTDTSDEDLDSGRPCGMGCSVCENPASFPKSSAKRDEKRVFSKRQLPTPQDAKYGGNVVAFLNDQSRGADEVTLGVRTSTAVYHALKNKPYKLTVPGLTGCTVVIVASTQAVYMSHHYEVPGFNGVNTDQAEALNLRIDDPRMWFPLPQREFEDRVLKWFTTDGLDMPNLRQYAGPNGPFTAQDRTAAYVIYPLSSRGGVKYDSEYENKVTQIINKVTEILGDHVHPIRTGYNRLGAGNVAKTILFHYDPVQRWRGKVQDAMLRIWAADRSMYIHQKMWEAHQSQKVPQTGRRKRGDLSTVSTATSMASL